jgi:hypothetical protein
MTNHSGSRLIRRLPGRQVVGSFDVNGTTPPSDIGLVTAGIEAKVAKATTTPATGAWSVARAACASRS